MIKSLLYAILMILVFASCGFNKTMKQYELQAIDKRKVYTVTFQPYKSFDSRNRIDTTLKGLSLPSLFSIPKAKNSPVTLQFTKDKFLQISYEDSASTKTVLLKGSFRQSGYYEARIKTKNIVIPPFYVNRQMLKFKFCLSQNGDLVIKHTTINEGSILLFGGGANYSNLYYFKVL